MNAVNKTQYTFAFTFQSVIPNIYPAIIIRADIARAASKLAEHLKNPGLQHLAAADHCIRYLYGTRHLAIEYSATNHIGELTATPKTTSTIPNEIFYNTTDASYASSPDRRSVEGYTFKLFGGVIDWSSRKQTTITTSTTEAELLAMLNAGKEAIWWNSFFNKIGFNTGHDLKLYNDNRQTVRLLTTQDPLLSTRLRHVDISQHWLRERSQNGDIKIEWIATGDMVADGLTKLLPPQKHKRFIELLGLVDISSHLED